MPTILNRKLPTKVASVFWATESPSSSLVDRGVTLDAAAE